MNNIVPNQAEDKDYLSYTTADGLRLGDDAVFCLPVERSRCLGIVTSFYQSRA